MTQNRTLATRVADLEAGQQEILSILRTMAPAAPATPKVRVQKAPEGGYVVQVAAQKAPEAPKAGVTCVGCGKPMVHNPVCKGCAKKGVTVQTSTGTSQRISRVEAAPKVAAKVTTKASAKGRTAADHCEAVGCSLFTKAGEALCAKHTLEACQVRKAPKKAPEGEFITLDDGKRGYRVPAALVLSLRAAGLDDDLIIAAAQKKEVGYKVGRAKGSLV